MKQDTINALAVIQATEDAIESSYSAGDPYLFEEHFLKGLKNVGKKLKETVKNVGKKVVDAVKTVTKNALLGPL